MAGTCGIGWSVLCCESTEHVSIKKYNTIIVVCILVGIGWVYWPLAGSISLLLFHSGGQFPDVAFAWVHGQLLCWACYSLVEWSASGWVRAWAIIVVKCMGSVGVLSSIVLWSLEHHNFHCWCVCFYKVSVFLDRKNSICHTISISISLRQQVLGILLYHCSILLRPGDCWRVIVAVVILSDQVVCVSELLII